MFFLRAASKDRTTVVDVASSPRPRVLEGLSAGWNSGLSPGRDAERCCDLGRVAASTHLVLLSRGPWVPGLGLVVRQVQPSSAGTGWPCSLTRCDRKRAERQEGVEIRLMNPDGETGGSTIRVRAHRDELIALELELAGPLDLASDGSLLSSPI